MAQLDLFSRSRLQRSIPQEPDLDKIRLLLNAALQELRAAHEMPWHSAQLRSWQHVFQNMTKWLSAKERDGLCRDFSIEISRLDRDRRRHEK